MNINEIVVNYVQVWNEKNDKARRELIEKTWTASGSYCDPHRQGNGYEELNDMVKTAQQLHPGYTVRISSGIESYQKFARFSWQAGGTPEAPLLVGGTDFVVLSEDGRLQSVTGFVDAAPAPTCAAS